LKEIKEELMDDIGDEPRVAFPHPFPCKYCNGEYLAPTRSALRKHISRLHQDSHIKHVHSVDPSILTFPCDKCNYKGPSYGALRKHKSRIHRYIKFCSLHGFLCSSDFITLSCTPYAYVNNIIFFQKKKKKPKILKKAKNFEKSQKFRKKPKISKKAKNFGKSQKFRKKAKIIKKKQNQKTKFSKKNHGLTSNTFTASIQAC
jgi:hypothetical protein